MRDSTPPCADIIRLQLRKPKNWNWQLSTSRSSPHIALPVIQLYNSKGRLLIETSESGNHRSVGKNTTGAIDESIQRQLQRCRSDTKFAKQEPVNKPQRNPLKKSSTENFARKARGLDENRNVIVTEVNPNYLKKSRSDADHRDGAFLESFRQNAPRKYNRGSSTDDLFKRTWKQSEESLKRAIQDGYRNFITPQHPVGDDKVTGGTDNEVPKRRKKYTKMELERGCVDDGFSRTGEVILNNKRYRTRTSSAGTLVISEESFSCPVRRRKKNSEEQAVKLADKLKTSHNRTRSDPITTINHDDKGVSKKSSAVRPTTLFHSRSDIFPVVEVVDEKCYDKCDYSIQEPITPSSDKNRDNILDGANEKRVKKWKRRAQTCAWDSRKSSVDEKSKAYAINGQLSKPKVLPIDTEGESSLLRLVRRLSTDEDVVKRMGANVSRHSSKGLSGRRSHSSGSICNGKGKHANGEQKMCGSLPTYLDEGDDGNGCNNNHGCQKSTEEDQRIPPLGDGAPLHWKFSDNQTALCDQGYGSERSPEEEYPPPLPDHDDQCHRHLEPHACYPFITPESTFSVSLSKGSRGLGLSVTGGVDSVGSWPGLIRVKRLFPHQLAAACGLLSVGDILLEANGIPLTGLTNYEAVEVLRTTSNQVELRVCRPPPDVLNTVSPISEVPPPPPRRDPPTSLNLPSSVYSTTPPEDDSYHGEFEVTLTKIQGSLGFTLRKEDDSALGHYVRALVREPALTDGRIHAGDKIIAVNGVEISPMTHEQAVQFLRQCGDIVTLRLYRDAAQTPVAALSPTETTPRTSFSRKAHLRQEAVDMLNDIAVRKLMPGNQDLQRRSMSPTASPRRLRRHPCPSNASHIDTSSNCTLSDDQFHEGLLQKCSVPFDDESFNSLFTMDSDEYDKPSRPNSLDLYNPNQTPVAARKPRFNFSLAHNAYELNNLDPEVLDAPNLTYNMGADDGNSTEAECGDSFPQEPASMPYIPVDNAGFSYKNPAYQTAHPNCGAESSEVRSNKEKQQTTDDNNMKKWKGVVFNAEEEREKNEQLALLNSDFQILAIELNRGWNSRLGFSLQGAAGYTYVSAVYPDSVAAKDGRLKPGDRLIKVNDESVEKLTTSEIIDLLRIVRGPVCIVVSRTKSKDCLKSNAVN